MSEWQYYVTANRICPSCGGKRGWKVKDGFHTCALCDGKGILKAKIALEDALADTEVIKDIRDAIMEMLND